MKKISDYEIRFLSEFKNLYRLALNNQKNVVFQTKDTEILQNSHLIINFSLKALKNPEETFEFHLIFLIILLIIFFKKAQKTA